MRIACVDQSAAQRVALQRLFDRFYEQCRSAVGHLATASTFPSSKDEALVNTPADVFAVGSGFPIEQSYSICRDLAATHPGVPILVFLKPEDYSLRTLRRFEKVCSDVFSNDDAPIRIVHRLSSLETAAGKAQKGRLVTISGVKGGVGATSIVAGLAHAATATGNSAVVLDLSAKGVFSCYMSAQRWQSPDYAVALQDGITPEKSIVERCITTAPNGISMLLPPSGGTDVRELWLRNPWTFEITLSFVEILSEMFDLVLVDVAGAEGILEFALNCRANARLLVTSNDPAAVHLLNGAISSLTEAPGDGQIQILINSVMERGLTKDDILDYLYCSENFNPTMALLEPIPFDLRAGNWIGTGNSFYTEGTSAVQNILEDAVLLLGMDQEVLTLRQRQQKSLFLGIKRLTKRVKTKKQAQPSRRALPFLGTLNKPDKLSDLQPIVAVNPVPKSPPLKPVVNRGNVIGLSNGKTADNVSGVFPVSVEIGVREIGVGEIERVSTDWLNIGSATSSSSSIDSTKDEVFYEPPKRKINE